MVRPASHQPPDSELDAEFADLVERLSQQLQAGKSVDIDQVTHDHPEHADRLRSLLPAIEAAARLRAGVSPVAAEAPDDSRPPGVHERILGDYRILREIGHGGMGVVYEAEQISLRRRVALKVLPFATLLDPRQLQRFKNESLIEAQLSHPNIVSVLAVGQVDHVHYFAMPLIEGISAAEWVTRQREPTDTAEVPSDAVEASTGSESTKQRTPTIHDRLHRAADIARQIAEALEYAHENGILHRDVKPSNILVDQQGKAYLTDFGLAHTRDAHLTMTGDVMGTLRYMSPEQALGRRAEVGERSDVYSLGATLYEMVTLTPMFSEEDTESLLSAIANQQPPQVRTIDGRIPHDLETIILKATAKEVSDRYASAQAMADDLQRFLEDRPIFARRPPLIDRMAKWSRRHRSIVRSAAAVGLLLVMALALGTGLVFHANRHTRDALDRVADSLYASDMKLAYQAWNRRWTDEASVMLAKHIPSPDQADRRGFEWHLLDTLVKEPPPMVLKSHDGSVNELAVFPDGKKIATVGDDGRARIWRLADGKLLSTISTGDDSLSAVAISPCGTMLATGENTVALWDTTTGHRIRDLTTHNTTVDSIAFSPDGQLIASASRYEDLRVCSIAGEMKLQMRTGARNESVAFSADSRRLMVPFRDRENFFWDHIRVLGVNLEVTGDQFGFSVALSDEVIIVGAPLDDTGAPNAGVVYMFDVVTGSLLRTIANPAPARDDKFGSSVAISGNVLVVGAHGDDSGKVNAGTAYLFDVASGRLQHILANPTPVIADQFGYSVAIADGTVIVGAPGDSTGAKHAGAAYAFEANGGTLRQTLLSPHPAEDDGFGSAVGIEGNRVVVGAYQDDTAAQDAGAAYMFDAASGGLLHTFTDPTPSAREGLGSSIAVADSTVIAGVSRAPQDGSQTGSVYVFSRSNNHWSQQQKVVDRGPAGDDDFGWSLALGQDTLAIGSRRDGPFGVASGCVNLFGRNQAHWEEVSRLTPQDAQPGGYYGNSLAIDGPYMVIGRPIYGGYGEAQLLRREGASWVLLAHLKASDSTKGDAFGQSVAISGSTVIVGACRGDVEGAESAGCAYIFSGTETNWTERQKLTADDGEAGDQFGYSVAICGDTIVVGSPLDDSLVNDSGAAYTFVRSGDQWTQQQKLTTTDAARDDRFGYSLAIEEQAVVVGAPYRSDAGPRSGAAYVFVRDGIRWAEQQKLTALEGRGYANFGFSVGISGETVVAGAHGTSHDGIRSGSVHVFVRSEGQWLLQQRVIPSDAAAEDQFGYRVVISGDTLVVSAHGDDFDASDSGAVCAFDAASGETKFRLAGEDLTPDGPDAFGSSVAKDETVVVVGACNDGTGAENAGAARVYDAETGRLVRTLVNPTPAVDDDFGCSVAAFGGKILVGANQDDTFGSNAGAAYLFDGASGKLLHVLTKPGFREERVVQHRAHLTFAAVAGDTVAIGNRYSGQISLLTGRDLALLRQLPPHRDQLNAIAFSLAGGSLASAHNDGVVRYWQLQRPDEYGHDRNIKAHQGSVTHLEFLDDQRLASCGTDGTVRVWNLGPSQRAVPLGTQDFVSANDLEFSADGQYLAVAADDGLLWHGRVDGKQSVVWRDTASEVTAFNRVAYSRRGDLVALCSRDSNRIVLWDVTHRAMRASLAHKERAVNDVCFSPNGEFLASTGDDALVHLWNMEDFSEVQRLPLPHHGWALAYAPTVGRLAVGGRFSEILVWDLVSGEVTARYSAPSDTNHLAFHPVGRLLASAHSDGHIRLWDVSSGQMLGDLRGHEDLVGCLAFSSDGETLASASDDGTIRLWSVLQQCQFGIVERRTAGAYTVALSPDGKCLAAGWGRGNSDNATCGLLWRISP